MSRKIRKTLTLGLFAGVLAVGTSTASAQGILKGDTGGVGSVNHTFMIVLSTFLQKKAGIISKVPDSSVCTANCT